MDQSSESCLANCAFNTPGMELLTFPANFLQIIITLAPRRHRVRVLAVHPSYLPLRPSKPSNGTIAWRAPPPTSDKRVSSLAGAFCRNSTKWAGRTRAQDNDRLLNPTMGTCGFEGLWSLWFLDPKSVRHLNIQVARYSPRSRLGSLVVWAPSPPSVSTRESVPRVSGIYNTSRS